jgi:VWFA-related protein
MSMRGGIAGALVATAALLGAPAGAGGGEPTRPTVYVESVRVKLVNVDVWVNTPDGATVYGLRPQDFELFEDGKPVVATNFSAPQPPPLSPPTAVPAGGGNLEAVTAAADQPLTLVILIDHDSVTPANRNAVLARIRSTLDLALASGSGRVMVATVNPSVRVRLPLTARTSLVSTALALIEGEVSTDTGYTEERLMGRFLGGPSISTDIPGSTQNIGGVGPPGGFQSVSRHELDKANSEASATLGQARGSAQLLYERARIALGSISHLLDSLAGVPGRKVVYYIGNGIPVNPGADTMNAWEAQFGRSPAAEGWSGGLEIQRTTLAPLLEQVVGRANASGVTLNCVDTSTNKRMTDSFAESRPLQSNTGLGFGTDVGRRIFLQTLAGATGGHVLANSKDLSADVAASISELDTAYSLAFAAEHGGDGKFHTVAVKVRRGGTRVRYRTGYVDKGNDDRMIDRSMAALFIGESPNPLSASLTLGTEIKQTDGTYVVPVIVNVPLGGLVLLPQGEVHVGSVSAWFASADEDGRISRPAKQTFTFKVANERLLTALSQSVSYPVQFLMKPGNKRVVASLRDDNGVTESSVVTEFAVPRAAGTSAGAHD